MTRRETFENLAAIWLGEVDLYSTIENAAKMVVGNKVDLVRKSTIPDFEHFVLGIKSKSDSI